MRVAAAIGVFLGAFASVTWLVPRGSSVIRELDHRYFVSQAKYGLAFAAGTVLGREMFGDWSWRELLVEQAVTGAVSALLMLIGPWTVGRLMRWARHIGGSAESAPWLPRR